MAENLICQQEGETHTLEKLSILLLLTVAVLLRIGHLTADPHGDEGVFYFLSESLFNLPDRFMFSEFLRRPLLPILYHPLAFSLESFRIINIAVGSAIPLLVYFILKEYGISKRLAISGAMIVALHPLLVRYSAFVFTDTLGTFFALLMLLFYKKEHYALSGLFLCLATLTKEYYAIAGLALIVIALIDDRGISRRICTYALALLPITILYSVNMGILEASAPGWDSSGISIWSFNYALLCLLFIPLYITLLRSGRWREFLLLCTYPAFYVVWHWGKGSGIDTWFHLLPVAISTICLCLALSDLAGYDTQLVGRFKRSSVLAVCLIGLCVLVECLVLAIPSDANRYHGDARSIAGYIDNNYDTPDLLLIDCFWSFDKYPFGEVAHATNWYTHSSTVTQTTEAAQKFELVMIDKKDTTVNMELRAIDLGKQVIDNDNYVLFEIGAD